MISSLEDAAEAEKKALEDLKANFDSQDEASNGDADSSDGEDTASTNDEDTATTDDGEADPPVAGWPGILRPDRGADRLAGVRRGLWRHSSASQRFTSRICYQRSG